MAMRTLVALALAAAASGAFANAGKLSAILQQQREIRQQSEVATGTYSRFERSELDRMHRAQDRIFKLLDGVSDIDQLEPQRQAELFNAIEEVKSVIANNEDDRQVCSREHKLGTTMKETICATVAERRGIREGGQEWKAEPGVCATRGGGVDCGGNSR